MKLYTDVGNLHSLKLEIACAISGFAIDRCDVKHEGKVVSYLGSTKLPVLEISPDEYLFSVNSAVQYLLCKCGKRNVSSNVEEWLEWEASHLQPVLWPYLVSFIGHNKQDAVLKEKLLKLLQYLNNNLTGQTYLAQGEVTSADIVCFGALYPVLCSGGAINGWETDFSHIKSWFTKLNDRTEIKESIEKITGSQGLTVFKASLLSQSVPLPYGLGKTIPDSTQPVPLPYGLGKTLPDSTPPNTVSHHQTIFGEKQITEEELKKATEAWQLGREKSVKPRERNHPILPQEGERNILITSALPYVNNVPHLGNIIGCVLSADVFSRYCRLRNYNCLYICGTDEYGTATETKAMEEGITPKEICDKYTLLHSEIYQWFNIGFDYFGRTSTAQQTEIAQDIFWKLYEKNLVIKDSIEQLYCKQCERFLADRFAEGTCPLCAYEDARGDQCDKCGKLINAVELKSPRCKLCKSSPSVKSTDHLFLDLPHAEPRLTSHLEKVFQSGTWTSNAKNITNSWIRDGLKPRCISRDLKWGTPVPLEGYTDKVFYVWFDAPIGYISITANYTDQWEKWWKNPDKVEMYNFLGKDNVPFHSVIFPCTLLGADDNYTIVSHMLATEYLNYEDGKFSKSRGVGVFGNNARDTGIPADVYRFYLLYIRPESQDSSFSWDDFQLKNNSELLNNLGNFINRGLMFLANSFDSVIQEVVLWKEDKQFLALVNQELKAYCENMEQARLRESLRNILSISRYGNQFIQHNKPWVLVKGTPQEKARSGSVVSLAANVSVLLAVLLHPYMPEVSKTIRDQLQLTDEGLVMYHQFVSTLLPGHKIGKPKPLFQKIENATIKDLKDKFAGKQDIIPPKVETGNLDEGKILQLTDEVAKQGDLVREMKADKKGKEEVTLAVNKLLELKRELSLAQGLNLESTNQSNAKKRGKGKKKS